jgi:ubiquitin carboxyl-terminal hydrolase 4/11
MSQDPSADANDTPRRNDLPTPPADDEKIANDIDAYMAEQGEASGEATTTQPPQATSSAPLTSTLTAKEKHDKIVALSKREMAIGETWYVVSRRWWKRWEKACLGTVDKEGAVEEKDLGPVNNSHLVDMRGNLIPGQAIEGIDVQFVPEEAWKLLVEW